MNVPTVLSIAGSDSSGGAGIQADLKAIAANGGYGATVVTAITAQNTRGVNAAEVLSAAIIREQIDAVFDDLTVAACKTGMLANEEVIHVVADGLSRHAPAYYVCDPVMISKSGFALLPDSCVTALAEALFPLASLVTPNVHEARALTGIDLAGVDDAVEAGRRILAMGPAAVLVKGGHLPAAPATDVLVTAEGARVIEGEQLDAKHTHGTGCTYSAAIATRLARGEDLERAVRAAKRFITEAIRHGIGVGRGTGPTDPFWFLRRRGDAASWDADLLGEGGGTEE